ncbi:MAG: hypothetical protein JSV04_06245 [Candidatus Heimdallarchaeota archaeon]|nr:MAG: hypothetical protein JSV04_06245 [Candidatus Heimdallarchaeota archaeon]
MLEPVVEFLPLIILVAGIIGLAYGINKFIKSKEQESDLLKFLALGTSIVIGVVNLIAIYEWLLDTAPPDVEVHWLTILLIFLAGSSMLGEPLKNTPIAAIIALVVFGALAGLLILFADFEEGLSRIAIGEIITIPLWLVILVIVIIVGLVFLATLFTEFTIDRILQLISWAPVVIVLSLLLVIQGFLILLLPTIDTSYGVGGIWELIPL